MVVQQPGDLQWQTNCASNLQNSNTDFSKKGQGTYCQKLSTVGQQTLQELNLYINVLELLAIKAKKSWKKGNPSTCLGFYEYSDDKNLCVVTCIDEYFRRSWRTQGPNQLFLSHLKLYKESQSSIIANWVKLVLKMAGVDTSFYKAHSCRSGTRYFS